MVSMSLYICQNSKNVQHLKVTPSVNSGLWLIIMCQCQFIFCNKCTTLVGDVDDGGGCACVGQGVYEKSVPSFQPCCECKTALKKSSLV